MADVRRQGAPLVIGDYALFGEIASGGMAQVHFGRRVGPESRGHILAVKRLHRPYAQNPEFVDMFLDEGRVTSRIQHPNVVSVLDVVRTESEVFLVMDYVHGEPLDKLLTASRGRRERVPPAVAVAITVGLLEGLHAAHEATDERGGPLGVVHRDVSPSNVLVGADGITRVLDFGVAKAAGRLHLTRDRQLKGKLAYMAPEQVAGGAVDRRVDVYAAAIVLWEMVVGRGLFEGANEAVVLSQAMQATVPAPSTLGAPVSPDLDAIVLHGLERDLGARYPTARVMAEALAQHARVASPKQVGQWVRGLVEERLDQRAKSIEALEANLEHLRPPKPGRVRRRGNAAETSAASIQVRLPSTQGSEAMRERADSISDVISVVTDDERLRTAASDARVTEGARSAKGRWAAWLVPALVAAAAIAGVWRWSSRADRLAGPSVAAASAGPRVSAPATDAGGTAPAASTTGLGNASGP
jgi:serine/threonine-protein kinase